MLKTIRSPNKPASDKNNENKLASNKKNNSKQVFGRNNGNGEVNGFGICRNGVKHVKKSEKPSKSGKKLSKNGNSTNYDTMEAKTKFLTFTARTTFNCLWLAFIKASIF